MPLPDATRRHAAWLTLVVVVMAALPAWGAPRDEPVLPPLSPEASSILEAVAKGDREKLREIAEARTPTWASDPWSLCHQLVLYGHRDAARRLATASRRPDRRSLLDYVRKLERRPPSRRLWAKCSALLALMEKGDHYAVRKGVTVKEIDEEPANATAVILREILAQALTNLDKWPEAMALQRSAAAAASRMGWWVAAAQNLGRAQRIAMDLGDYRVLIEVLEALLETGNRGGDQKVTAHALADLASVHGNLGNFDGALASYRQVIRHHRKVLSTADLAHILNMAGLAELNLGHIANATRSALESLDLARTAAKESAGPDGTLQARERAQAAIATAGELQGIIAMTVSDYDVSEQHYLRAEAILAKLTHPVYQRYRMQAVANRGVLETERGHLDKAEQLMRATLSYWEAAEHAAYLGRGRSNLGEIERRRAERATGATRAKHIGLALRHLGRAIRDLQKAEDPDGTCSALIERGRVHGLARDFGRAHSDLDDALAIATDLASVAQETEALTERAQTLLAQEKYAEALAAAKDAASGTSYLFDRLTPRLSALARHQTARIYEIGLYAAARLGGKGAHLDAAFHFLDAGRAVALLMRLEGRKDLIELEVDEKLRTAETATRAREAKAYAALLSVRESGNLTKIRVARAALADARAAHDVVISRIQLEEGWSANLIYPSLANRKQIEDALGQDEVLTLYGATHGRSYVLLMQRGGSKLIDLGPESAVHAACAALDIDPDKPSKDLDSKPLRDLIVKPLGLGKHVKRILFSTAGCLSYEPPSILFPDHEVCCVASGTAWLRARDMKVQPGRGVLALGDPDYRGTDAPEAWDGSRSVRDGALVRLKGSGKEARAVGDVILVRGEASETRLRDVLHKRRTDESAKLTSWRAIHLACHGLVNRLRPAVSGLALAHTTEDDGLLRAGDIARLHMDADLVVLSACESGRGEEARGEGIHGFTSMFQMAGARRVIVSLWKVDDEATRVLMIKFHEHWNAADPKLRKGAAEALRAAQHYVRDYATNHGGKHPEWKHPHYWAAWQLWGPTD